MVWPQRGEALLRLSATVTKLYEPIVEEGQADVLIAFEKLECNAICTLFEKDGVMIVNDQLHGPDDGCDRRC